MRFNSIAGSDSGQLQICVACNRVEFSIKGGNFCQQFNKSTNIQIARVISEAVTNAIRRASTGTAGTVHANEQNNEVFYLFHRFITFIIQIEAQGLFAYLNICVTALFKYPYFNN